MTSILFAPHGDDETLFAFYTLLRYRPHVVVVLTSGATRFFETQAAAKVAGVTVEQWGHPEHAPDWARIRRQVHEAVSGFDRIMGPAFEVGGHEHHNGVAGVLDDYEDVRSYLTYRRGHGRSSGGVEVVPTQDERELKRQALDCYKSQLADPATAPWFGDDQREFVL